MTQDGFDVVLIAPVARRTQAVEAIGLAGGRVLTVIDWAQADTLMSQSLGRPVLLLEAEGVGDDVLAHALPHLREMAQTLDLRVVAAVGWPQIDVVTDALLGLTPALLCEADLTEHVAAIAVAGRQDGAGVRWREDDAERLKTLNAEIGRIAELLARLADRERGGGEASPDDAVGDRHLSFGFQPPTEAVDPQMVRRIIRGRRMRDAFFGEDLFGDPAWDMLLDLYAAQLEGVRVSVSSLCIAAAVAPTTALRWITRLTEGGVFERQADPDDRRRAFLTLSLRSRTAMDGYVAAMRRADLPFA